MMIRTLAAGVALAAFVSGAAWAAPPQTKAKASATASPSQPIPYGQLEAYSKASPKQRASQDWWSGSASTGASSDTSAAVPPAAAPSDMSVNPPAASSMPSDSSMSMPATPPASPEATMPAPGSNLPSSNMTPGTATEQK